MIQAGVTFTPQSVAEFRAALTEYRGTTKKDLSEIINERSLKIASRAFDIIPPPVGSADDQRARVAAYLKMPLSTRVRVTKGGKRKGKFIRKGSRNNQLQLRHLIIQARRRRAGKKGLYGSAMRKEAGRFARVARISVGYIKSIFIPIIRGLQPFSRWKFPFWKTSRIYRWPGGAGHGIVKPASPSVNPSVIFTVQADVKTNTAYVQNVLDRSVDAAMAAEAAEMREHVRRKMQHGANRIMHPSVRRS